jgi:methylamine dehydrogenase accessory protein MauD
MTGLLPIVVTILFIAVLALAVATWALSRQVGILFERVSPLGALVTDSGPAVGGAAPVFDLPSITRAAMVKIGEPSEGRSTLLFFLSPNCPVCKKLLPVLRSLATAEASWMQIVLASDGNETEQRAFAEMQQLTGFPYVLSTEMGLAYRVARLPFAVLIGDDGLVKAKGLVNNREQLDSLLNARDLKVASIQKYFERERPAEGAASNSPA